MALNITLKLFHFHELDEQGKDGALRSFAVVMGNHQHSELPSRRDAGFEEIKSSLTASAYEMLKRMQEARFDKYGNFIPQEVQDIILRSGEAERG